MLIQIFQGVGYPSSSREIDKYSYKYNDCNGYYEILGLSPICSMKEIKDRYRELSKKFHPDGSHPDVNKFREINEVYLVLSDPIERQKYNNIEDDSDDFYFGNLEKNKLFENGLGDRIDSIHTTNNNNIIDEEQLKFYTFISDNIDHKDSAQKWYDLLLQMDYLFGKQRVIKVAIVEMEKLFKIEKIMDENLFWFHANIEPNWMTAYLAWDMSK